MFLLFQHGGEEGVRIKFHNGISSKTELEAISRLENNQNSPVIKAYVGLSETILADHAFWPNSKWSYFKKGKRKIEEAILAEPGNAEIRYIRLMVQLNAPTFVGYSDEIEEDLQLYIDSISSQIESEKWIKIFTNNLLDGNHLNNFQKQKLSEFNL